MDFDTLEYLRQGNSRQQKAYTVLTESVFEKLKRFDPILTGTVPINIDTESSDLDIACCWEDKAHFIMKVKESFSSFDQFECVEKVIAGEETVIARFRLSDFPVEVFGQRIPVRAQMSYRHMLIEHRLLEEKGEPFRQEIIHLKKSGLKTEPAFAKALGLQGDPYLELLKLETEKKDIFLIPGLGADERIFKSLELAQYHVHYIRWIRPQLNESLSSYAGRLKDQINSTHPILLGVSFGGIVASEIAKLIETERVIIVSSIRTRKELPFYFKLMAKFDLRRLLPRRFFKQVGWLTYWFFGLTDPDQKKLLRDIIRDTDDEFIEWALEQIGTWQNLIPIENSVLIHGDSDRIFPFSTPDISIRRGGHFMILNKAPEINRVLNSVLP